MAFEVVQVPVWQDNYAYVLCGDDGSAAVVDAPEADPVLAIVAERGLRLTHLFNTHHHFDHIGANDALAAAFPDLVVVGSQYDFARGRIPRQTRAVQAGDAVEFAGVAAQVLDVAGHTLGHIAYQFENGCAFVGDSVFVGGCGRLFEGTAQQLDRALNEVIAGLPGPTLLYCAHEYTLSNLRFARSVDPDNEELAAFSDEAGALRAAGRSTVPTTVAQERSMNPFLRADARALRAAAGLGAKAERHEVVGRLRAMKDGFQ